jgi:hypothetical protein
MVSKISKTKSAGRKGKQSRRLQRVGVLRRLRAQGNRVNKNIQAVHKTCIPYAKTDGSRMTQNLFVQH